MTSTRFALGALVLGLVACSDGATGPGQGGESSLTFSYAGPVAGRFEATGAPRLSIPPLDQMYVHGQRFADPNAIVVSGIVPRSGNMVDGIFVTIPGYDVGSFAIEANACPSWDDDCAQVLVFLQLGKDDGSQARYSSHLETGTIRLTSNADGRATGEFSGSGRCLEDVGDDIIEREGFVVSNGRFEVTVVNATRG